MSIWFNKEKSHNRMCHVNKHGDNVFLCTSNSVSNHTHTHHAHTHVKMYKWRIIMVYIMAIIVRVLTRYINHKLNFINIQNASADSFSQLTIEFKLKLKIFPNNFSFINISVQATCYFQTINWINPQRTKWWM